MSEKRLDFISAYEKIVYDLRKESGKLIQKNCISCELVNLQTREIDKLKKENEQLKQKLENLDLKARERSKALSKLQKSVDEQQVTINELRKKLKKYEDKEFERTQMRGW